jgi:hypothetical protein
MRAMPFVDFGVMLIHRIRREHIASMLKILPPMNHSKNSQRAVKDVESRILRRCKVYHTFP